MRRFLALLVPLIAAAAAYADWPNGSSDWPGGSGWPGGGGGGGGAVTCLADSCIANTDLAG